MTFLRSPQIGSAGDLVAGDLAAALLPCGAGNPACGLAFSQSSRLKGGHDGVK
jgi:hypothetical protein